jgi:hypothetical protein
MCLLGRGGRTYPPDVGRRKCLTDCIVGVGTGVGLGRRDVVAQLQLALRKRMPKIVETLPYTAPRISHGGQPSTRKVLQ